MKTIDELEKLVSRFNGLRIGVVGDLMADTYLTGTTDRVSREAPVLIVRVSREELVPGGAANVACNLSALGAKVKLFGATGSDSVGTRLKNQLKKNKIDLAGVYCDEDYGTVRKTRILAGAEHTLPQQVMRVDHEPSDPPSRKIMTKIETAISKADREIDAWIISDYGYQLIDETIIETMRSIAAKKPVLADSRYQIKRYTGLTAIKPNEQEAIDAAEIKRNGRMIDMADVAEILKKQTRAGAVIVTLGNQGMLVYENRKKNQLVPAVGTDKILDLTGAGDTAGATLILALAAGADFYQAATLANCAGSVVVMKYGCASCSPAELLEVINEHIEK
jgi:rfaE bifunctional protein kinase chain/domain